LEQVLGSSQSYCFVVRIDLSASALAVGFAPPQIRTNRVEFIISTYDLQQLAGEFDLINCVGVLHHLPDQSRVISGSKVSAGA